MTSHKHSRDSSTLRRLRSGSLGMTENPSTQQDAPDRSAFLTITQRYGLIFATQPSLPVFFVRENAPAVVRKLVDVVDPPT
jgi:hypothetical protein